MNNYQIKTGLNGKYYAVFRNGGEAQQAENQFEGCLVCCFDGYENAYELTGEWIKKWKPSNVITGKTIPAYIPRTYEEANYLANDPDGYKYSKYKKN